MDFSNLREFQDWMSDEWRIPGSTCVAYLDGEEVYSHSSGYADVENKVKMKGDELFFMFSISKVVTSLAAMMLLEKGLFHLNDNLSDYMPEFADMKVKHFDENGKCEILTAKNKIKVRDIFQMTSGYDYNIDSEEIKARMDCDGNISTMELARALAETPLCFEPGTHWCYGLSHDILAAFVEKISGVRFSEFVQKNIFDPIGMKDARWHIDEKDKCRMARLYHFYDEDNEYRINNLHNFMVKGDEHDSGGAGLIATASDMALLADTVARGGITKNGERIITKPAIDLWRTNCLGEEQLHDFSWDALAGYGYGLGVRTHINRAQSGSLSPLGEFGWSGAAGGFIIIDPDTKASLFYCHHMLNNQEPFTNPRIRNLFYDGLYR